MQEIGRNVKVIRKTKDLYVGADLIDKALPFSVCGIDAQCRFEFVACDLKVVGALDGIVGAVEVQASLNAVRSPC